MGQITVISGPERQRVWVDQQKRKLVAAVSAPRNLLARVSEIKNLETPWLQEQ